VKTTMSNKKVQVAPFYHRAMITPTTANEETREIEVCFASDADVPMWSWEDGRILESLSMEGDAMKLERMNSGAPLLNSHDTHSGIDAILGKVVEGSVRVENGNAYCKVRFSMRDSVTDIWNDVKDGIIRNLSVGYNVHSSMYTGDIENTKRYVATSWEPFEVSLVSVPADYRANVRDKDKTNEMVIDGEVKVTENGQKDRDILKIKQIILK
jgi:HK97 family phage prohead protease